MALPTTCIPALVFIPLVAPETSLLTWAEHTRTPAQLMPQPSDIDVHDHDNTTAGSPIRIDDMAYRVGLSVISAEEWSTHIESGIRELVERQNDALIGPAEASVQTWGQTPPARMRVFVCDEFGVVDEQIMDVHAQILAISDE